MRRSISLLTFQYTLKKVESFVMCTNGVMSVESKCDLSTCMSKLPKNTTTGLILGDTFLGTVAVASQTKSGGSTDVQLAGSSALV